MCYRRAVWETSTLSASTLHVPWLETLRTALVGLSLCPSVCPSSSICTSQRTWKAHLSAGPLPPLVTTWSVSHLTTPRVTREPRKQEGATGTVAWQGPEAWRGRRGPASRCWVPATASPPGRGPGQGLPGEVSGRGELPLVRRGPLGAAAPPRRLSPRGLAPRPP